jgi:hypothetical protein
MPIRCPIGRERDISLRYCSETLRQGVRDGSVGGSTQRKPKCRLRTVIVEAVGLGVRNFAAGDHVFANAMQTYASLCVVKAEGLARIPDRMDVIEAAAVPTVAMTGAQWTELTTRRRQTGILLVTGQPATSDVPPSLGLKRVAGS